MTSPEVRSLDPSRRGVLLRVLAVTLAGALVGCTASPDPPPGTLPTASATPPATATPTPSSRPDERVVVTDEEFLATVRSGSPGAQLLSDEMILSTARTTCSALDEGRSYMSVVVDLTELEVGDSVQAALVGVTGAAIPALCPVHMDEFD